MLSKNQIKLIRSLKQKKYRQKYNKFICEGIKSIREVLKSRPEQIEEIYLTASGMEKLGIDDPRLTEVSEKELSMITQLSTNQEGLALISLWKVDDPDIKRFAFFLDGIRDPGNLGTILRVSDWFGLKHIFLSEDCVDVLNPKVIQASMGSVFRVHCHVKSLPDIIKTLNPQILGADMHGDSYAETNLVGPGLIVLGNEARGISDEAREKIDHYVSIPGVEKGAESLNVGVSAGILAAHFALSNSGQEGNDK